MLNSSSCQWVLCDVSHYWVHSHAPPSSFPPASEFSLFAMCHRSKLTYALLLFLPFSQWFLCDVPHFQAHSHTPPSSFLQQVIPCLWCPTFPNWPAHSSIFLPSSKWVLICNMPCFEAHQPTPPTFSPSASESLFAMCHISELINPLLPLPPCLQCTMFLSSSTHSPLFLPFSKWVLICNVPHFRALQHASPFFSPPASKSCFVTCNVSELTNLPVSKMYTLLITTHGIKVLIYLKSLTILELAELCSYLFSSCVPLPPQAPCVNLFSS
jgi:hypothetical protein